MYILGVVVAFFVFCYLGGRFIEPKLPRMPDKYNDSYTMRLAKEQYYQARVGLGVAIAFAASIWPISVPVGLFAFAGYFVYKKAIK